MYDIREEKEAIKEVQRALRELSGAAEEAPSVVPDGIYGEVTQNAVRQFQKKYGLSETGRTDYETWRLLTEKARLAKEERTRRCELFPAAVFLLQMGDSGSHIRILQSTLGEILDADLPVDGFYGGRTEEAVRTVERRYGLTPTGIVDTRLWRRIAADYATEIERKCERGFVPS